MEIALIFYGVILLAIFLLPVFDAVHNAGTVLGAGFGAVTLAAGIYFHKFTQKERGVILLLLAVITLVVFFAMYMIYQSGKSRRSDAKVILVLGCRVRGREPSKALCKRVDRAYYLLTNIPESVAVLSGGQGSDELISEAQCMKDMLVQRGVSPDRLYCESLSTSTDENIAFSTKLLAQNGLSNEIYLVTSDYHQKRALMLCEKYALIATPQSSKTKALHLPTFLLREILGLVKDSLINN